MLFRSEAYSGGPVAENVVLVQRAFARLKQQARVLLALVMVRLRAGLREQAGSMRGEFEKLEFARWALQGAEIIRARLEGRVARKVGPPPSDREITITQAIGQRGFLKMPSVELPPEP